MVRQEQAPGSEVPVAGGDLGQVGPLEAGKPKARSRERVRSSLPNWWSWVQV